LRFDSEFLPLSDLPGISALYLTYLSDFPRLAPFYAGDPRSLEAVRAVAGWVEKRAYPRAEVASALRAQHARWGGGPEGLTNIQALEEGAFVVFAGQQAGLFGGPLYTLYKAIAGLKLADRLTRELGRKVVGLFWMAADDHDFAEIDHTLLPDKSNQLARIAYSPKRPPERQPESRIVLEGEIARAHQALAEVLPPTDFRDAVLARLAECYSLGRTFPEAFARWMMLLLGEKGLVVVDPSDPALKQAGKNAFRWEIESGSESSNRIRKASDELKKAGFHVQVELREGGTNLFFYDGERHSVKKAGEGFEVHGRTFSKQEVLERVDQEPERFSPNVALRPIYQDTLFPNIAYIGGPAEVAYYGEYKGSYEAAGLPMPVVFPRTTVSLVEPKIKAVFDKYIIGPKDIFSGVDPLITRLVEGKQDPSADRELEALDNKLNESLDRWGQAAEQWDKSLLQAVSTARGGIKHQLEGLARKLTQAYKRKNEELVAQVRKAALHLLPEGTLQERTFPAVPFLVKYGFRFVDDLYESLDIERFQHQAMNIDYSAGN
jgi:bacillithiol biosynthesis cysteine-adding enzyme BshC